MKLRKRFSIIFTAVMVFSLAFAGVAVAKSPNKIGICHNNGNGTFELVKIKVNTLQEHLAHGDAVPGEAVPSQPGMVLSANCSLVTSVPNPQAPAVNIPPSTNNGKKADKVNVCHKRGNETFILININGNALPAHLAHGDGVPDGLVPGQPHGKFTADCSITEIPQRELVQSLSVSSLSETPVTSMDLVSGQLYEIKAIGTYTYDPGADWADAEWLVTGGQIIKGENWLSYPANVLDLTINGCANNTDWGAYQSTHEYTLQWTGAGAPLTFTICDTYYPDNVGSLTVEIWQVNW